MEKTTEQLQKEYDALLNTQCFTEKDLDYRILEQHIPHLERISEISNSVIMVFDLYKREHVYVSANISHILDLDPDKCHGEPSYINERIHPDDLYCMLDAGLYFLKYGLTIPVEKRRESKLVNTYRVLNEKNKYIRVIEQQICIENDIRGNAWLSLGIIDISPDQSPDAPFRSRLIDTRSGAIYLFPPQNKEDMLTSREKEILQLIANGLISKQIADRLYISVNTVNTHRQRILEKLRADNTVEAIRYASGLGIL
ncbi:MAG: response regulator transcription factor [Bacteroidetes bacterium]|nr:response regulator transcription factor [Bacteroidota bacterium]